VLEQMDRLWLPVEKSWRLNERHYGALQGLNKAETAARFGEAQVLAWRRSYDTPPPALSPGEARDAVADPRYAGWVNCLRERSWFGMRFLFETAPDQVAPFDYEAFHRSPRTFVAAATDCATGLPVYFRQHDHDPRWFIHRVHRASCSLPLLSPPVTIDGRRYYDGGVSDPIPLERAMSDGNYRNVVVLTRNAGYRKQPRLLDLLASLALARYPAVGRTMKRRTEVYNACLERLAALEEVGRVFIFRPVKPLLVGRLEREVEKLELLYRQGYEETLERLPALKSWIMAQTA